MKDTNPYSDTNRYINYLEDQLDQKDAQLEAASWQYQEG